MAGMLFAEEKELSSNLNRDFYKTLIHAGSSFLTRTREITEFPTPSRLYFGRDKPLCLSLQNSRDFFILNKVIFILTLILSLQSPVFCKERQTVAVMPFLNSSQDPALNWLSEGIAETLSTKLSMIDEIRVVERSQIEKIMKELKFALSGFVDPKEAVEVGKFLSARFLVIGSFQIQEDKVWLQARLTDVEMGENVQAAEAIGKKDDIFALQSSLAKRLILAMVSGDEISKEQLKNITRGSITGFRNFRTLEKISLIISEIPVFNLDPLRGRNSSKYLQTLDYIEGFLEENPDYFQAYIYAGIVYLNLGKDEEAEFSFKRAIELSDDADAYFHLGNFYRLKGEDRLALDNFEKALQIDKRHPWSCYGAAVLKHQQDEELKAVGLVFKALENKPDFEEADFLLRSILRGRVGGEPSCQYFNRLLAKYPDSAEANLFVALCKAREGEIRSAKPNFEKSLEAYPNFAKAHYYLGVVCNEQGRKEEAIKYLDEALSLYPAFPEANLEIAQIYDNMGRCRQAVRHYKNFIYFSKEGSKFSIVKKCIERCESR